MTRRVLPLLALIATACAAPPRPFVPPPGAYGDALKEATRAVTIHDRFATHLLLYATWESPEFRSARSEKLARVYEVLLEEAESRGGALTRPVKGHAFFLAVHAADRSINDLERADSQWALILEGSDGRARPARVARFARTVPGLTALYPHADRFFVPYRVVFPEAVGDGPLRLRITGPMGEATVTF